MKCWAGRSVLLLRILAACLAASAALLLFGCGQASPSAESSSSAHSLQSTQSSLSVGSAGSRPISGKPFEIYRVTAQEDFWESWISGDTVVWLESPGPGTGAGYGMISAAASSGTILRSWSPETGKVEDVPGSKLAAPDLPPEGATYMSTLPSSWAAVLSGGTGTPKVVWAEGPKELGDNYIFRGLWSWVPGTEPKQLLPESFGSSTHLAAGDALAIFVPSAAFLSHPQNHDPSDPASWQKVLLMTANMDAPIEVDPSHPELPASALEGLSPYFSFWSGTSPGQDVYDLRTGAKLAVRVPDQGSLIAGHWAASYKTDPSFGRTNNVDIVLTDLETGESKTVTSFGVEQYYSPVFALSADWLVVLKPGKEVPTNVDSTTTLPDQHIGADLVAAGPESQRSPRQSGTCRASGSSYPTRCSLRTTLRAPACHDVLQSLGGTTSSSRSS